MSNICACCQSKMKFIRQINGNFKHSIVIPEWFVNHFRGKISGTIRLEAPNGNRYDVGVTENMNRIVLQSGWEAFVDANQIKANYSLMFRYLGISRFEVTIFDSNGMEKISCCAGTKIASNVQKPSKYYVDITSSSRGVTTRSSADEGSHPDGCQKESSCHYGKSTNMPATSYSSEELSAEDSPSVDGFVESDDHQMLSKDYVLSAKCDLTEAQEAQIHALVRKIQPKIPLLVVRMKKSNVKPYNDLAIRKDYALTYFPHESQTITLQLPKKRKVWQCRFHIRPDRGERHLKLREFVHDNRVQGGDICLFQPITKVNARRFMVAVHLLPKESLDHSLDGKTDIGSNHDWKSTKMASTASVKEEPATDGEEISSSENEEHPDGCQMESSCHYGKSAKKPATSYSSEELSAENNPSVDDSVESDDLQMLSKDYVLSGKCNLTEAQEAHIHALVRKIQPKIPLLVVQMKKSNVKMYNELAIHKDYALTYFPHESQTITLQLPKKSKVWQCRFHIRPNRGERRHLFMRQFVHDTRVREGDICLFQPITEVNARRFTVVVHLLPKESVDRSLDGKTDIASNHDWKSAKMASIASVKEEPATDGEEISSSENEEHALFMLPNKACLTQAEEKKVLWKVQAIESELPIYVAIMNKTSVYGHHTCPACILVFGWQYATSFLGTKCAIGRRGKKNVINLELQREGHSKTWHTVLRRTRITTRIQKGWMSFACDNRLRERDICLFNLTMKNEKQLKMMVYIIRRQKC